MKIITQTVINAVGRTLQPGQPYDLTDEEAKYLIARGWAEVYTEKTVHDPPTETATIPKRRGRPRKT